MHTLGPPLFGLLSGWVFPRRVCVRAHADCLLCSTCAAGCTRCSTGSWHTLCHPTRSTPSTHTTPRYWASTWTHGSRPLMPQWISTPRPCIPWVITKVQWKARICGVVKGLAFGGRQTPPGFQYDLFATHISILSFNFLVCKMRV